MKTTQPRRIIVLAVSPATDGRAMKKEIEDYATDGGLEGGVEVTVVTQMHEIQGRRADEFVMTPEFGNQRSIRLLDAASRIVTRGKHAQKEE